MKRYPISTLLNDAITSICQKAYVQFLRNWTRLVSSSGAKATPARTFLFVLVVALSIFSLALTNIANAESQSACSKQHDTEFLKEVVRSLGIDGKACFRSSDKTYCLSRTREEPKAITVDDITNGDRLRVQKGLFLCVEQFGGLGMSWCTVLLDTELG